jgi:hypothetical protein
VPEGIPRDLVVMPGTNGVEMAIAIRREFVNCRILLFSGQAVTADLLDDARSRGYNFELLAKPVHPGPASAKSERIDRGRHPYCFTRHRKMILYTRRSLPVAKLQKPFLPLRTRRTQRKSPILTADLR